MRDINRIYPIMNELTTIWTTYCPDWRFGQLISNFKYYIKFQHNIEDIFYIEDDKILEYIKEFKENTFKCN